MFMRHVVHIAAGIMMADVFTWSVRGMGAAVLLALASPVVTLAAVRGRGFFRQLDEAERVQERIEQWGWRNFVVSYLSRAGWYTMVTLVAAHIARSQAAG